MNIAALREVMHKAVPFDVKTSDGSVYSVKHPDFASVGKDVDDVVVVHTDAGLALLSLKNITAIESVRSAST